MSLRSIGIIAAVALALFLLAVVVGQAQAESSTDKVIQYEVADNGVKFVPGEVVLNNIKTDEVSVAHVPAQGLEGLKKAAEARSQGDVVAAPNMVYTAQFVPNDPRYDDQWYLPEVAAPGAWNNEDGVGARVCVVDAGYDHGNTDLDDKVIEERDSLNQDGTANPSNSSHGTMVGGIVGAETDNNLRIAGTGYKLRQNQVKILDANDTTDSAAIIRGLQACQNLGNSSVINMSWGGYGFNDAINAEIQERHANGYNLVAAAGNYNDYTSDFYPCGYSNVICVSATNKAGNRAVWNASANSGSNWGPTIDLAAPGTDMTTLAQESIVSGVNGTSFAAPQVAATAGMLRARGLTRDQTQTRLFSQARDYAPLGEDDTYGKGFLHMNCSISPNEAGCN